MTDRDQVLDRAALFKQESIRLYRLARTKYADLSGEGAALVPGRWNATGERAIYTSTEMPMTLLERLVHTPKDRIPADLSLMDIDLSGRWEPANRDRYADSNTGLQLLVFESLAIAEQYHQDSPYSGATLALAVPSVIAPVWNVVLSPQAWRFWHHVTLSSVELFSYDPRLFLRDAKLETA